MRLANASQLPIRLAFAMSCVCVKSLGGHHGKLASEAASLELGWDSLIQKMKTAAKAMADRKL